MNKTLTNNEVKLISSLKLKKFRDEHGLFLIEGEHLVSEFVKSGAKGLKYVIAQNDFNNEDLLASLPEPYIVKKNQFNKFTETKSPQGILAVAELLHEDHEIEGNFVVALDTINDPGNLGTIIRTCYWFGVDKIIIGKNSADVYNPKSIRASQGAVFHVDFIAEADLLTELESLHAKGYNVYLAALDGHSMPKSSENRKSLLVFGNEANGISSSILANNNYHHIKIKPHSNCESLNVSVSAGIIIHHFKNLK